MMTPLPCDAVRRKPCAFCVLLVLVACSHAGPEADFGAAPALVGQGAAPIPGRPREAMLRARCDTEAFYATARVLEPDTTMLVGRQDLLDSTIHDCQRLIANEQLGPLVGLLVSSDRVVNANFAAGAVVAEIANYDTTPFTPLGIQPEQNCLWLRGSPDSLEGWTARIFQPAQGRHCTDGLSGTSTEFGVIRRRHSGQNTPDFYPSTGRWMWDGTRQGVGIRCGNAWCEFGPTGYTPPHAFSNPADVPGWYDEQRLTYMSGNTLVLSGLVGRISPHSTLKDMPDKAPVPAREVARITFTGSDPAALAAYRTKFGLTRIPSGGVRISHRQTEAGPRQYRMRSRAPWRVVHHNPHPHSGRGTVRWVWSDQDERAWYSCEQGCCTTDQLDL